MTCHALAVHCQCRPPWPPTSRIFSVLGIAEKKHPRVSLADDTPVETDHTQKGGTTQPTTHTPRFPHTVTQHLQRQTVAQPTRCCSVRPRFEDSVWYIQPRPSPTLPERFRRSPSPEIPAPRDCATTRRHLHTPFPARYPPPRRQPPTYAYPTSMDVQRRRREGVDGTRRLAPATGQCECQSDRLGKRGPGRRARPLTDWTKHPQNASWHGWRVRGARGACARAVHARRSSFSR